MRVRHLAAPLAAIAVGGAIAWHHRHELGTAISSMPAWTLGVAVALHLSTLVLRTEAWRQSLAAAAGGTPAPRRALHLACAGTYLAGTIESHAAIPVRIALIRRLAPGQAPSPASTLAAESPIVVLEVLVTALVGSVAAPAAFGLPRAVALLVPAALIGALLVLRHVHARAAHTWVGSGLAVLACRRRRARLATLVGALTAIAVARVALLLAAAGLPADAGAVGLAFVALGVFGLLPIGPAAPAGAALAILGSADPARAGAFGLAVAATGLGAALVYGVLVAVAPQSSAHALSGRRAFIRPRPWLESP